MGMVATGNGRPQVCALNLVRTVRGEVPYARAKGIDRALIDLPSTDRWRVRPDAQWVVESYEPRVVVDDVTLDVLTDGMDGDSSVTLSISD